MSLNLEHHLVFYGAYHSNPTNKVIHLFGVPLILFSSFCLATYTGTLVNTPSWLTLPYLDLNLGTMGAYLWGGLYILLEPVAGTVLALGCVAGTALLNKLHLEEPGPTLRMAVAVNIVSWILQFVGHSAFERRKPALMDNLVQAVFLAPLFVWLELLFMLGYRPELQARVHKKVQAELVKLRAADATSASANWKDEKSQ